MKTTKTTPYQYCDEKQNPRLLLYSDSIHCYKRQTIEYIIHNDKLNEWNTFTYIVIITHNNTSTDDFYTVYRVMLISGSDTQPYAYDEYKWHLYDNRPQMPHLTESSSNPIGSVI